MNKTYNIIVQDAQFCTLFFGKYLYKYVMIMVFLNEFMYFQLNHTFGKSLILNSVRDCPGIV